jgi:pilus assembly protein Flp/PilA
VGSRSFLRKEVVAMLFSIRERGQGMVEYAFLFLLIALVVIAVLLILGPVIGNVFSNLNSRLVSY